MPSDAIISPASAKCLNLETQNRSIQSQSHKQKKGFVLLLNGEYMDSPWPLTLHVEGKVID